MDCADPIAEFRASWLPHITDRGIERLLELLRKDSPLLIHGAFTKAIPMGCLATQAAWNHPRTCRLQHEAGITWLTKVAGLNPATSTVILAWDRAGTADCNLRWALIAACEEELERRHEIESGDPLFSESFCSN